MPDRVVALQLLSSCWLAVILPPLPTILCFSAIYTNDHHLVSSPSSLSTQSHQGRKFGGYRIIPKPCKISSTLNTKDTTGVCMFNYECTQNDGTVIGSCMDGFLYGSCCKLPPGIHISTVTDPTTTTKKSLSSIFRKPTPILKPQIFHSPEETFLLYENGSIVENTYSPDDFVYFTKQQTTATLSNINNNNYFTIFQQQSDNHIKKPTNQQQHQNVISNPNSIQSNLANNKNNYTSIYNNDKFVNNINNDNYNNNINYNNNYNNIYSIQHIPSGISPSQIFDLALTMNTTKHNFGTRPAPAATTNSPNQDRSSTLITSSSKSYPITSTESLKPNNNHNNYGYPLQLQHTTTGKAAQPWLTSSSSTTSKYLNNNNNGYTFTTVPFTYNTNNNNYEDNFYYNNYYNVSNNQEVVDDGNLVRVSTISAPDSLQKRNDSIHHIIWLLNQTKIVPETETEMATSTQSLYTWVSVQGSSPNSYTISKPLSQSIYQYKPTDIMKQSTSLPSTTIHHIPGPSFHVTPEVKITPKPQPSIPESVPTVIVLTPAYATSASGSGSSNQSSKKPPIFNNQNHYNSSATPSSEYNPSYHHQQIVSANMNKHTITAATIATTTTTTKKPFLHNNKTTQLNVIITAKPSSSSFGTIRPVTSGYISKPIYQNLDFPNKIGGDNSINVLQTTIFTTPKPIVASSSGNYIPNYATHHNHQEFPTIPNHSSSGSPDYSTALPLLSASYISVKPSTMIHHKFGANPANQESANNPTNLLFNSTEDMVAFPPDREPNFNMSATQHEKPLLTATTSFGDEDIEQEVNPQLVVDKTLEDKVHVFVEKIVQSLQGNFEDLEKVLLNGESTQNVTINNNGGQVVAQNLSTKKPSKKPTSSSSGSSSKPAGSKPQKITSIVTTISTTTPAAVVNKKPSKKPPLASPVVLFQPSSSTSTSTGAPPTKNPSKLSTVTTTVYFSESATPQLTTTFSKPTSSTEEPFITTNKNTPAQDAQLRKDCGIRPLAKRNGRIVGGKGAAFGEWPWQVLVRESTWLGLFTKNKCGGVLITNRYVITAAHCQPGFLANLVAVFGEYDISGEVESKRSVSRNVRRVIVHRQYDPATFENDIALLELELPLSFDTHIVPICMPDDEEEFTGRMATVTGWGRLKYNGGVPSILQEVQVPVIENQVCQEMFQTAEHPKVILNSFLCAGYANGQRDSCEGDSGGPLMVERDDGKWVLVATVSHGIRCAAPYLPGVYMRTTYYKPWLQTITGVHD